MLTYMCCLWPTHKCAAEMVQTNTQETFNYSSQSKSACLVQKSHAWRSSFVWLRRNKELPVSCPGFCRVFLGPFSHCLLQLEKMLKTCQRPLLERRNISKSLRNVSRKVLNLYHKDLNPCEGKRGPNLVQARCS